MCTKLRARPDIWPTKKWARFETDTNWASFLLVRNCETRTSHLWHFVADTLHILRIWWFYLLIYQQYEIRDRTFSSAGRRLNSMSAFSLLCCCHQWWTDWCLLLLLLLLVTHWLLQSLLWQVSFRNIYNTSLKYWQMSIYLLHDIQVYYSNSASDDAAHTSLS